MKQSWSLLFSLDCYAVTNSLTCDSVIAQVTRDGTTNTTVNSDGSNNFTIENGDRAEGNLFHSFDQFSVPTNGSAVFNNAPEIDNIFSRVTGGNISNIDGLIQANDANLFLVNPAGILFGNNARLDIGGSFLGTTADSILFEDGEFSAIDFDNPPLLTVNAPIGLGFRDNPQPITNQSIADDMGLKVDTGKNVTLVGGDIFFDGGVTFAPGGRVELGGLAEEGTVSFNDDLSLNFSEDLTKANVSLTNEAVINVRAGSGGSIAINSRNLEILEGSKVRAGIASGLGSPQSLAGNIDVNSTETITISGANTFISNAVIEGATGNAGDANITTESLVLSDGGQANSLTQGQGNAGNVNIAASDISLDGIASDGDRSGFFSTVASTAAGNGDEINIKTESLSITNGAGLIASTFGQGNAGNVNIQADTLSFDGVGSNGLLSGVFNNVEEGGVGNAGSIEITTWSLSLTNGAQLAAATFGQGNAGNVNIQADTLSFDGVGSNGSASGIFSTVSLENAVGDAGGIDIVTGNLSLSNGAFVQASTFGQGNTGVISIKAGGTISSDNSTISSSVGPSGVGNSGRIEVTTSSLYLINDAVLQANTFGQGNAGNILVKADDSIFMSNDSSIASTVRAGAMGNGGNITVESNSLTLLEGAQVQATVFREENDLPGGQGLGGKITVNSEDFIDLSGFSSESFSSSILTTTEQGANGDAGDIIINTGNLRLSDSANVNAATRNSSSGGDITINANTLEATSGGQVRATTRSDGNAGNINLNISDKIYISGSDPTFSQRLTQFDENFVSDAGPESGLFVNATPNSTGKAGSLTLSTRQLNLSNQGTISASSQSGEGGNIELRIDDNLTLRNNGLISAQAFNEADGGNLTIDTNFIIAFPNQINGNGSDIIASSVEGEGGEININAQSLFGIEEREAIDNNQTNDIDASSEFSLDGTVSINTPDLNPLQGATELPTNVVEPEQTVAQACAANRDTGVANSFVVRGKGGVPSLPTASLNSELITINGKSGANSNSSGYAISTSQGNIIPARGVIKTENGQVILTAMPIAGNTSRTPNGSINCGDV